MSAISQYSFPGLAAATGTRVDSAAKHTLACKVHENLMMCWCENPDARNHLHNQKMKYCMHKNDLVLNVTQPLNEGSTLNSSARAYPAVVSNLGDMTSFSKHCLRVLHAHGARGKNYFAIKDTLRSMWMNKTVPNTINNKEQVYQELQDMPYFVAQGYALGIAYASNLSGDTVGTVLIGGMMTVMNGHFEMRAGQPVQWYFEFEAGDFYHRPVEVNKRIVDGGVRKEQTDQNKNFQTALTNMSDTDNKNEPLIASDEELRRKRFYERELGDAAAFPENFKKHNVFYPKPYKLRADGSDHYADKIRVFAKCITGGRPWEMVDIMLMTQSL